MKTSNIVASFISAAVMLSPLAEAKKPPRSGRSHPMHIIRVSAFSGKNYYPTPQDDVRRYPYIGRGCRVDPSIPLASIAVEVETGKVVAAVNADGQPNNPNRPASLTKLMTLYLTFEALEKKQIKLGDMLPITSYAAHQERTNLNLRPGDQISVEDAIRGTAVQSANDAAMVLAEKLGGDKDGFASLMNAKAQELGMKQTKFLTPSGVPILDGVPMLKQVTTVEDMGILGLALQRKFPSYMHYLTEPKFTYPADTGVPYVNHNPLLGKDGIVAGKTGYECMSGWNLEAWANRGGKQYIVVVLGAKTKAQRVSMMVNMLNKLGPATPGPVDKVFSDKVAVKIINSAAADISTPSNDSAVAQAVKPDMPATALSEVPDTPEARIAYAHSHFAPHR